MLRFPSISCPASLSISLMSTAWVLPEERWKLSLALFFFKSFHQCLLGIIHGNNSQKEFICYIKGKIKIRFIFHLIKISANSASDIFLLSKYSFSIFKECHASLFLHRAIQRKSVLDLLLHILAFVSGVIACFFFTNGNQH